MPLTQIACERSTSLSLFPQSWSSVASSRLTTCATLDVFPNSCMFDRVKSRSNSKTRGPTRSKCVHMVYESWKSAAAFRLSSLGMDIAQRCTVESPSEPRRDQYRRSIGHLSPFSLSFDVHRFVRQSALSDPIKTRGFIKKRSDSSGWWVRKCRVTRYRLFRFSSFLFSSATRTASQSRETAPTATLHMEEQPCITSPHCMCALRRQCDRRSTDDPMSLHFCFRLGTLTPPGSKPSQQDHTAAVEG